MDQEHGSGAVLYATSLLPMGMDPNGMTEPLNGLDESLAGVRDVQSGRLVLK